MIWVLTIPFIYNTIEYMHTNTQLYAHMLGARIAVIWVLTKRNQEERKFCCDMGFDKKKSRGKEVLL